MQRLVLSVLATILLAILADRLCAREIFVNNLAGHDGNDGSAPQAEDVRGGPVKTITRALEMAEAGDRIVLAKNDEPYRESITLQAGRNSGLYSQAFVLDGGGAILDGSQPVPPGAWQFVRDDVFRFQPHRLHHQNLYLGGVPLPRIAAKDSQPLPALKPLEWCLWRQAIHFRVEPDKGPRSYELSYAAHTVGVTLYEVRNAVVSNLTVQGFQLDGVNAHDGAHECELTGLICRGNGRSGISIGGASRVAINNCLVGDNGVTQLRVEGRGIARVTKSQVLETGVPPLTIVDGGRLWIDGKRHESKKAE